MRDEERRIEETCKRRNRLAATTPSFAGNYVISRHKEGTPSAGNGGDIDRLLREWRAISGGGGGASPVKVKTTLRRAFHSASFRGSDSAPLSYGTVQFSLSPFPGNLEKHIVIGRREGGHPRTEKRDVVVCAPL